MAESSPHNHHPRESSSGCSSDISVDLEPHPAAVDGHVVVSYSDEGILGSNSSTQCLPGKGVMVKRSDAISNSSEISNCKRNQKLGRFAVKFSDEKTPVKKKLKWLKQVAMIKKDGTVQFEIPGNLKSQSFDFCTGVVQAPATDTEPSEEVENIPPLQIVMLIVGTRGDVQPFVAIGKCLQGCGHRVRLATHANFKDFVLTAGLEFFPLGGDPKVLAGCSNTFSGHTHVAEALKVPLHVFFTMPWTPTSEFPHPLSRVRQQILYRLSYQIVDSMIWLGIRDIVNEFRKRKLGIRPVTYLSGSYSSPLDVPYGYIWSPQLVPKPKDWGPNIDVVGFCFLDLASNYQPADSLVKWLEAGKEPIYIGFGSLPIQNPEEMTGIIIEALEITQQRGIISKGWGGLGNSAEPKKFVYLLDNCPHDWLFQRCIAVD
ncbi:hypothetical protein I3842_07G077200 [Carya illinoinensis]|uniref:Glycosyltransferase family 28 N-terminal domain-containing protein n=1 Tax=Carya illinoinensis TaxID=32201 RepID=A0A922EKF7_CARIL|nr:hypothetical protein I3842_07G077200 [Carya illinoinensis]